jgi:RNA 2',3'-cyclic 3'-phosphodiesterase
MRTFIAIKVKLGPVLAKITDDLKDQLKDEKIRWVDGQNIHLTLKFLGETSEKQIPDIKNLLSVTAFKYNPFSISLGGLGFFKSNGIPRVLFAWIHEDGTLSQLADEAGDLLVPLGFEKDKRPFNPHFTLARIQFLKNKSRFNAAVDNYRNLKLQESSVSEIIFFQSILNPSGPVYQELAVFPLA